MDVPLAKVRSRLHNPQPYPFLANDVWADFRKQPPRWPWIVAALLVGVGMAALVTDWSEMPFFRTNAAYREPRPLPVASTTSPLLKPDTDVALGKSNSAKDQETILPVDQRTPNSKLSSSTPELPKHFEPRGLEQQQPKSASPGSTMQTGIVRLPPLSQLKIYFPRQYREAPLVKLTGEIVMPSEVTIDEITVQFVVIRNAHPSNDCSFRYVAEGKLKEESVSRASLP